MTLIGRPPSATGRDRRGPREHRRDQRAGGREGRDLGRGGDLGGAHQQALGQRRVVGLRVGQDEAGEDAGARAGGGGRSGASGTRTTNSLRYGPGCSRGDADRGQRGLELGGPGGPERGDVAQAVRARSSRGRSRRPGPGAPGWCRCCWPPCRAGCPARGRASSSRTPAGRRGPSVIPTSRPGIWRTSASVEARIPRYGPPYCGAMPSGWPSPAAMSAPYAPGGARTARETGSMTATNSAPAAWASRPISGIGSSSPRKSGWAAMTPATGRSGSASIRSSAARSVVPAASPSATSGISSSSRPPSK